MPFRPHMRRSKPESTLDREKDEFAHRFTVCSYLITERQTGATIEELAALRLAGRSRAFERWQLEHLLPQLVAERLLSKSGELYLPSEDSVVDAMQHVEGCSL